jgi:hypothetical protein
MSETTDLRQKASCDRENVVPYGTFLVPAGVDVIITELLDIEGVP